jgi:hypothetical protein
MANYFSKYQGRGGPAIEPGIVQMMGSIGDEYAKGIEGLSKGLEKYRQNKETRDMLEETALNEYARQLPAGDEEVDPIKSEYLSQYGEKVRDASDMSIGDLKGLVSSMQTDRNEMQKQQDHELQEKIYDLKERDTARLEAATIADIGHKKDVLGLEQEKQVADIAYKGGMLDVEKRKTELLENKSYWDRFDVLEKEKQEGKSKAETQAGLREMFKGDTSDFGKQVSKALEGDFDPELMRPWLDSKIKAEAARITQDELGKPELHDYNGQKVLTYGNSIVKLDNIDGKLQMQPDKLEQLRVRIKESVTKVMGEFPYAAELDRLKKDPDAPTPIQDHLDELTKYDAELIQKYGAGARNQSGPPTDLSGEREAALKAISDGAPEDAVRKRFKEQNGVDL